MDAKIMGTYPPPTPSPTAPAAPATTLPFLFCFVVVF